MGADGFEDRRNFFSGKAELPEQCGRFIDGISDMIPPGQGGGLFRAVPDKDPQVVHPGGSIQHVVIERLVFRELGGEVIEAGLVAEFVGRLRLGANVTGNGGPVTGLVHRLRLAGPERRAPALRSTNSSERSTSIARALREAGQRRNSL